MGMRHHSIHTLLVALLLSGGAFLSGCGGSSGGTNEVRSIPNTRLLPPAAGQSWTYSVTGSLQSGGYSFPLTGTYIKSYVAASGGSSDLYLAEAVSVEINGQPFDDGLLTQIHTDSSTGNVQTTGIQENNATSPVPLSAPVLDLPSSFSLFYNSDQSGTQGESGQPYRHQFKVIGIEKITVPAGTFKTWHVQETTIDGTSTTTEEGWYAPEFGREIKANTSLTDSTTPGSMTILNLELSSTTVAPPNPLP